jgi:hypothetical protein
MTPTWHECSPNIRAFYVDLQGVHSMLHGQCSGTWGPWIIFMMLDIGEFSGHLSMVICSSRRISLKPTLEGPDDVLHLKLLLHPAQVHYFRHDFIVQHTNNNGGHVWASSKSVQSRDVQQEHVMVGRHVRPNRVCTAAWEALSEGVRQQVVEMVLSQAGASKPVFCCRAEPWKSSS